MFAGSAAAAAATALAECPEGYFCAWTDPNFGGQRSQWAGDDNWWEGSIADQDSSWANHLTSGPGVKDHVTVYASATTPTDDPGDATICLRPGDEVAHNATADDRGNSHSVSHGCDSR
ncbi:peptidase inhibitor family I36 protein [Actinokineospora terrae]